MQRSTLACLASVCIMTLVILLQVPGDDSALEAAMDKSIPYVGGDIPHDLGYDGRGIVIGVIDTGVDYTHPDLRGLGKDGKVLKSYNFFNDGEMRDTDGHGTEVAGVIAADGDLRGMAPAAKVISYKVSDDGNVVSPDLIIQAIRQAIEDGVDVINISLGMTSENVKIDAAVDDAIEAGIVVVAAAGNEGPTGHTIGSPGLNHNAITVGATYNNLNSSMVATLEVDGRQYYALPMIGTLQPETPIVAEIEFGGYARARDLWYDNFTGNIMLAERGSDLEGEIVYFSEKESNAADAGAIALVVYNNNPGIYMGELLHELAGDGYEPRIPTVSISREDGMKIRNASDPTIGTLHIFKDPDYMVHFSSRGPVSSFYIKPDLVAPGAFINSTIISGEYNLTSGTSFAAPHVAGAAALLLQKNPELTPREIKSILVTTSDPVYDAYGELFETSAAGSGRLNVTKAFSANLILDPLHLVFDLSPARPLDSKILSIDPIDGTVGDLRVMIDVPDAVEASHRYHDGVVTITADARAPLQLGEHAGHLRIATDDGSVEYSIPILLRISQASIRATENGDTMSLHVDHPGEWTYAKITVTHPETKGIETTSLIPGAEGSIRLLGNGTHWIEAKIEVGDETVNAFTTFEAGTAPANIRDASIFAEIPIMIILGVSAAVLAAGFFMRRR